MRLKFHLLTSLFLVITILLQSCVATIVSTPKQKVSIITNPSDATVYLNDKKQENSPTKIRVKRNTGGEIKIEKEGYKTHNEILYQAKHNPVSTISLLLFVFPYMVDANTGAAFRLNKKELNVNLIKIPNKIENSQAVFCNEVNLKIRAGDKLGNLYLKEQRGEILYFGESLDVDDVNLKQNTNGILKDLGFNVAETNGQLFSPTAQARYFIKAEVLKTKYDIISSSQYKSIKYETICEMNVNWQLVDRSDKVLFESSTTGVSSKQEKGGTAVFYDAFENSFYEFLYNEEIYTTVEQAGNLIDVTENFSLIKIAKPKIKVESEKTINNATNSIVTVENNKSHGSGCIISEDGYIVTNYHVVAGSDKVGIKFKDGISLEGTVVRVNEEYDLALIKVAGSGYAPIPILEDKEINTGSDIYAIGTPADKTLGQTVTKGIISGTRKILDKEYIQTDVSINPGSSGGGLINKQGFLVGIVNAKLVGESVEGIGFAIPSYILFDQLKIQY